MGRYHQQLEELSRPQDRGFSYVLNDNTVVSSVEDVLFPLYSCVQVIQSKNPNLITIPELITPPISMSWGDDAFGSVIWGGAGSYLGMSSGSSIGGVLGSALGSKMDHSFSREILKRDNIETRYRFRDDLGFSLERSLIVKSKEVYDEVLEDRKAVMYEMWSDDSSGGADETDLDYARQEASKVVDDSAFDIYCKCRQFIDVAKDKLKPEEVEVLDQVISRTEGASYRKRYDELFHPKSIKREDDKVIKPLVLPDDFFHNPSYFDPSASVIGVLSDKVVRGGGQRFAIFIECLASRSFGYIQPSFGNKRLLASRLSGCKLETSYTEVEWIDKRGRSVSETEKVMLWLTNYLYGGGYDRAYEVLNFERHVKPGQETANLKNADKILRDRISLLYLNV